MKNIFLKYNWEMLINFTMLIVISLSLAVALCIQLVFGELPCPLCLLQRVGFFAIAFGLLLNLRFGCKPVHYSVVLISSLLTVAVSLRQIALHIIPGTGSYGSPLLGLHLYTWSCIAAFIVLFVTSVILGSDRQYRLTPPKKHWSIITNFVFTFVIGLLIANTLTTVQMCGFSECPGNPGPDVANIISR